MNLQRKLNQPLRLIQITLALLWVYQGLVPKLLFQSSAEIQIWQAMGFDLQFAKIAVITSGIMEILFGAAFLVWRKSVLMHQLNILGLTGLLMLIVLLDPEQLTTAFNPVVMNIAMMILSIVAIQLMHLIDSSFEK